MKGGNVRKSVNCKIQGVWSWGDTGFDTVHLYVSVKPNSEFSFCKKFLNLVNNVNCNTITVKYFAEVKGTQNSITAYFEANGFRYYIDITTYGDTEGKLNFYVSLLTN